MSDVVVVGALGLSTSVVLRPNGRRHGVEMSFCAVADDIGQAGGAVRGFAALGYRAAMVGHVGDDPAGRWTREVLDDAGVDLKAVGVDPAGTARSVNLVSPDGSRHGFYDGRGHLAVPVPERAAETVASARLAVFHLSNWSRRLLPVARTAGVTVAVDLQDLLDPDDPYRLDFVEQADILFFSAVNVSDVDTTTRALLRGGADRVIVAGMGARGCAVGTATGLRRYRPVALDLPVIDTNGAPVTHSPSASSPPTSCRADPWRRPFTAARSPPDGSVRSDRAPPR